MPDRGVSVSEAVSIDAKRELEPSSMSNDGPPATNRVSLLLPAESATKPIPKFSKPAWFGTNELAVQLASVVLTFYLWPVW
jgi:hypothetical protein